MKDTILEQYAEINKKLRCAKFYKADLHIHTPGSKKDGYSVNGVEYEKMSTQDLITFAKKKKLYKSSAFKILSDNFDKDDLMAELIVHEAFKIKQLDLIAITDHNTIEWCSKVIKAAENYFRNHETNGRKFCILPGVEITCFSGTHMIAIFDCKKYKEQWEYLNYEINGIGKSSISKSTFTTKSEIDVITAIKKVGGIAYMPHIDTWGQKIDEILEPLSGSSKIQLFRDKNLSAIGFSNYERHKKIKEQLENPNHMYSREYPLAYLKDSDAHDLEQIGNKFMFFKMEKPSFQSLKFAFNDPKTRIRENIEDSTDLPYIKGIVTRKGYLSKDNEEYTYYPLCQDLNCIIGGKGTGKSTLINCLNSCLKGVTPTTEFRDFMSKFEAIFIYFYINSENYCITCVPSIYIDSYTGQEANEYGDIKKSKITNIENWLKLYKIDENTKTCIRQNENKTKEILKSFYVDYFAQTDIMKIGTESKEMRLFFDNIIMRSEDGITYSSLIEKYKRKVSELNELSFQASKIFYSRLENADLQLTSLEQQIFSLICKTADKINLLFKDKVKVVFRVENSKEELLNVIESKVNEIEPNKYNIDKIVRVLEYLYKDRTPVNAMIKLLNNSEELLVEITKHKVLANELQAEVINADISDKKIIELLIGIHDEITNYI
ncbi:PHP domain-containing protein, partial [Anaerosolibacter sp.]|uniref:PHP domain-containing protein n=1 Tax=Anaerosolibacter sp. TaxID=1872527 RepID=UPI0039F0E618